MVWSGNGVTYTISIHALREEGDADIFQRGLAGVISIHALREEGDVELHIIATDPEDISIHALREEGDGRPGCLLPKEKHFYPRPPRGGRPMYRSSANSFELFLSTPSARRATLLHQVGGLLVEFLSTPSARRATGGAHDAET